MYVTYVSITFTIVFQAQIYFVFGRKFYVPTWGGLVL